MSVKLKGVDISYHNGNVDFETLKKNGIEFVILRCGYGQDLKEQDDKQFKKNVEKCIKNNIPYGVYLYSYANTIAKAKSEAEHTKRLLKGLTPAYGVWYDVEDKIHPHDRTLLTDIVCTFCNEIEKAGFYVGVYASLNWFKNRFDKRIDKYDKWVAQWSKECTYDGDYGIWQFTDSLKIGSKKFDGNYAFKNYPLLTYSEPAKPSEAPKPKKKSNEEIVLEVISGKWGTGSERKRKLMQAGYDYKAIQKRVNEYYDLAHDCYMGKYGNGNTRKSKVTKMGYDYKTVQNLVNEMV